MSILKLRLVVDVDYDLNGVLPGILINKLENIPRYAVLEGWFTGATNAEVDVWSCKVEVIKHNTAPSMVSLLSAKWS